MKRTALPAKIYLIHVILLMCFRLYSQELTDVKPADKLKEYLQASPREEIYLHPDRDKYIAGEDIWFKIYTIDMETGKLSAMSALAYVELLNPWNIPVIQTRLKLSEGVSEGNILLPDSISTGTYTLRAYTNWMKNFLPDNCYVLDIDICNPFRNSGFWRKGDLMKSLKIEDTDAHQVKKSAVILTADTIFGRREKVTLKLGTKNYSAEQSRIYDMSISVISAEIFNMSPGIEDYFLSRQKRVENKLSIEKTTPHFKYESEGHYLSVMIKYREDKVSDSSRFLYMSIQGKVAEFRYAGRDSAGRFTFILPVDNKFRNLIIQPEHANRNMVLEIEPSFSWVRPSSYSFKDSITDSELDVFSELSFNYQAAKIYGTMSKREAETNDENNLKKRRFYGIPEMEINLDDYIMLPTMQEVFFELIPGVILKTKKSDYEILITNPLTGTFYNEPPLVMIDGVIINDLAVLVDLNPETVEKVEVVKTPYLIGDMILHGIVNVITRSGNFSNITMPDYAVILPYRVVDKPSAITLPHYSDEKNRLSRTPDLRNTLYWNPSVKTDRNGEAEIEFWTSDLPGKYIFNIQGISGTGEKISLHKSFTVR
jgi:hypothetical protein